MKCPCCGKEKDEYDEEEIMDEDVMCIECLEDCIDRGWRCGQCLELKVKVGNEYLCPDCDWIVPDGMQLIIVNNRGFLLCRIGLIDDVGVLILV